MNKTCIFCQIIAGKIPSQKVYEDEKIYSFHDINPLAPVHALIVPKKHLVSLAEVGSKDQEILGHLQITAKKIAKSLGVEKDFRLETASGKQAGQTVFHLHYHLLGGWKKPKP